MSTELSTSERRRKKSRRSSTSSKRDSLTSLNDVRLDSSDNLVRRLEDRVRREYVTRQHQQDLNAKLQDEYDQLRKRLAEAETYIDQLRLGASVKFDKKFVFTYDRDATDNTTSAQQTEGTQMNSRRRCLTNDMENDTSTISSNTMAKRAGTESMVMAHLFEVRDLEEQIMALKQQLEAATATSHDEDKLKELYDVVKTLQKQHQQLSEAMTVNNQEEPLNHKQAQEQSVVVDELSRVTGELQQLQQLVAQYSSPSHNNQQQVHSLDEMSQESSLSSDSVDGTWSTGGVANHVQASEMVADTLQSSVPEEYLVQTGTVMSTRSQEIDRETTTVTNSLSNLSLDNHSTEQQNLLSVDSYSPQAIRVANEDEEQDATPTEDFAGGSEWSDTSSQSSSSILPYSEQTPLAEQRKLVSSPTDDDNGTVLQPHPPLQNSHLNKTPGSSQQPSRIPVLANKHLKKHASSDNSPMNDNFDFSTLPRYQSTRQPAKLDDIMLNNAQQQPQSSRIPVLNPSMSPTSSYYRPPSPYDNVRPRGGGVGGRYPSSPHNGSTRYRQFVADEADAPSPGKAGRETLPKLKKDTSSSSGSEEEGRPQPRTSHTGDNQEMKVLQQELRGLRELLEQQQQQQKPPFDLSTLQHPFWQQPGPFPFSNSMQNSNPIPPTHRGSAERTTVPDNAMGSDDKSQHVPSERTHPGDQSHPLISKVSMDTSAQQDHVQYPEHVLANGRKDGASNKPHTSKTTNRVTPHKKRRHYRGNVQYSSTSQTNQSDSSISSLTSSSPLNSKSPVSGNKSSMLLSELDSTRLSPLRASSPRGASPVTMETIRVPNSANLSTWVCPLCGGRSIIIDNSGARQHRHQNPDESKTRSKSTQNDASCHRHGNRSTRNRSVSSDPINGGIYSDHYIPKLRSSGLHHDSDTINVRSDHGYNPNHKSRSLYYDDMPSLRSTSLNRNTVPNIRSSSLDYSHSAPHIKSKSLHYDDNIPGIKSKGLHYNRQTKPYKRFRRKDRHKPRANVTFSHPKATSTPAYLYSTTKHDDYTSDSSDVSSNVVGGAQHVVLESAVPLPDYVTHHHIGSPGQRRRCYDSSRHVATSSDDEIEYRPITRSRPLYSHSTTSLERSHVTHVSLDEACRLARKLKQRSEKMHTNLSLELSAQ